MFKLLSSFQKFQSGSSLWLIFFEPERHLFRQINWRTGFLLQDLKRKKTISQPVLVDTYNVFPNDMLVCFPLQRESWFFDAYNCWKKMKKPSLRVFIPSHSDEKQLNQNWPQSDSLYNLSCYRETKR